MAEKQNENQGGVSVTITKLTPFNVRALREELNDEEKKRVTVEGRKATFAMPAREARDLLIAVRNRLMKAHGGRLTGHPMQSLVSPINKLRAIVDAATVASAGSDE